jgi:hypothetical protein
MVAPWVEAFIGECAAFPSGAHDDQVDAWSQGAQRLLPIGAKPPEERICRAPNYLGQYAWMA